MAERERAGQLFLVDAGVGGSDLAAGADRPRHLLPHERRGPSSRRPSS